MITKLTTKITPNLIKVLSLIFATVILMAAFALPKIANAATVSFSLSASASSVEKNDNFVITARVNVTSGSITDILGNVNYDSSKVQYVSISYTGGGGTTAGPSAYASGSTYRTVDAIKTSSNLTGNFTVANITFKALKSSGSASFSISGASYGDGDTPTSGSPSVSGTSVSMTAPPEPEPEPEPKPKSSTPSSSKPSSSTPSSSSPSSSNSEEKPAGDEEEEAEESNKDNDDPVEVTGIEDKSVYMVQIRIIDKDGEPVANKEITLGDQTSTTDDQGHANFTGVAAGEHTVSYDGMEELIEVETGDPGQPQVFSVSTATGEEDGNNLLLVAGIAVGLVILGGAGFVVFKKIMNNRQQPPSVSPPASGNSSMTPGSNSFGNSNASLGNSTTEDSSSLKNDDFLKPNPPGADTVITPDSTSMANSGDGQPEEISTNPS